MREREKELVRCYVEFMSVLLILYVITFNPIVYTVVHESMHYVQGLLDNNVIHIEMTLFGEPRVIHGHTCTSYVEYWYRDSTLTTISYEQRENDAMIFGTMLLSVVLSACIVLYVWYRVPKWYEMLNNADKLHISTKES